MTADKWRFLGGKVYRLHGEYQQSIDAIRQAKKLSIDNHVHISRTNEGYWVVYWRPRDEPVKCSASHYRVA
ncbi:MAG: hypothetical protein ACFFEF_02590 [Candidatus Thorarchaeota archaeon]